MVPHLKTRKLDSFDLIGSAGWVSRSISITRLPTRQPLAQDAIDFNIFGDRGGIFRSSWVCRASTVILQAGCAPEHRYSLPQVKVRDEVQSFWHSRRRRRFGSLARLASLAHGGKPAARIVSMSRLRSDSLQSGVLVRLSIEVRKMFQRLLLGRFRLFGLPQRRVACGAEQPLNGKYSDLSGAYPGCAECRRTDRR
jgi:hypothetical protein